MNINNSKKGNIIYIAIFVMTIIMGTVLGLSVIMVSEIKIVRGMVDSVISFFVADSGIEKTFYYDRKVIPERRFTEINEQGELTTFIESGSRGLCNICEAGVCPDCRDIQCSASCDSIQCTDCRIKFYTEFGDKRYDIEGIVYPSGETVIKSIGSFRGVKRAIELKFLLDSMF